MGYFDPGREIALLSCGFSHSSLLDPFDKGASP